MLDGSSASAGGFPAITEQVAFLMKDLVLFSRVLLPAETGSGKEINVRETTGRQLGSR
jgi:hypothetical protein